MIFIVSAFLLLINGVVPLEASLGSPTDICHAKCNSAANRTAPVDSVTSDVSTSTLDFMLLLGKLKTEKRNGWLLNKIANPESIADHMYRMAILSMLLDADGSQGIDKTKCVKLALLHDVAECIVGDITPKCGVPADVKKNKELKAMGGMMKMLEPKLADEIWELYEEYEDQKSVEAQVVKDLDRFEMLLTAYEYEKTYEKPLQDFFDTTNGLFRNKDVKRWVETLYQARAQLPIHQTAALSA